MNLLLNIANGSNFVAGAEWLWMFLVVIVLAVIGAIAVIKAIKKELPTKKKMQLNTLRDRLVKGEITQEEYDKLKKNLNISSKFQPERFLNT